MRLVVRTPRETVVDRDVDKVVAEAANGSFGLLPRHVDFGTVLVPGILAFTDGGLEEFLAVEGGTLVKLGGEVLVAVGDAVRGPDLGSLERTVRDRFRAIDDRERRTRSVLARLEADFVRRFLDLTEE